jgi:hypothetical protein
MLQELIKDALGGKAAESRDVARGFRDTSVLVDPWVAIPTRSQFEADLTFLNRMCPPLCDAIIDLAKKSKLPPTDHQFLVEQRFKDT